MGAVATQGMANGLFQLSDGRNPARALNAGAARDTSEVDISRRGDRRLAAGRLVLLIVPTAVGRGLRLTQRGGRQRTEIHPERAIAGEDEDFALRERQR